jgi:hypothetical protein
MLSPHTILAMAALSLATCLPLTLVSVAVPHRNYETTRDIAYGKLPRQRLDVYAPAEMPLPASR